MPQAPSSAVRDIERTLTTEAQKIGKHFQKIDQTSADVLLCLGKLLGKSSNTYVQWESITTSIQNVAKSVREISTEGQAYIEDVLSSFHDYLCFSTENAIRKAREIQGYKTGLDSLGIKTKNVVAEVFTTLEKVQVEIRKFTSPWPTGDTQYSKSIGPRIEDVKKNIKAIQSSIEDLRACKARISNIGDQSISFYDSKIKIVRSLSLLLPQQQKGHLHNFLKGSNNPEVEEAQAEVDDQVFNSLDTLINVGQMLSSDISELQRQFNQYSTRHDLDAFKNRFDSIRSLYDCLPKVLLREFNKACYTPEKREKGAKGNPEKKPSVFKKFLRLFGIK